MISTIVWGIIFIVFAVSIVLFISCGLVVAGDNILIWVLLIPTVLSRIGLGLAGSYRVLVSIRLSGILEDLVFQYL